MLKFNFKPSQGGDVPIHMLSIYVRSCDVFIIVLERNRDVALAPFPIQGCKKGWRCMEETREGGSEGVHEWMLAFLLRRPDIIKDSPCVLPSLSSKGMLAPGSSACYCVALAEKRQRKCLRTAEEEEEEEEEEGARGDTAQAVFPIYQQGGGYTNNSACFPHTCARKPFPCSALFALFCSVSHSILQFNSVYFCHPLNISLFLTAPRSLPVSAFSVYLS